MYTAECIPVVELPAESNGLLVTASTDVLCAGLFVVAFLGESYDDILAVVVGPGGNEYRILVVERRCV